MKKFYQKNKWLILALCTFITIPGILFLIIGNLKQRTDWLSFWGSYLGSIITIAFAYINTQVSSKEQSENLKLQLEQSKQNDLDNAIKLDRMKRLFSLIDYFDIVNQEFKSAKIQAVINTKRTSYAKLEFDKIKKIVTDLDFFVQKANNIFYITDFENNIDLKDINKDLLNFKVNDLLLIEFIESKIPKKTTEKLDVKNRQHLKKISQHINKLNSDYDILDKEIRKVYKQETLINKD